MEGTTFGRYQLREMLGHGGMGEVWRAYDTTSRREVALKVLLSSWASDEKFQQRFMREAYAAAGLTDPHVVPIHNFGEIDGRLYVDMRLVEGRDLQVVLSGGHLDPARAVSIVEQVASALNSAHKVGLVHRDVKPSNVLLTENDFAYLIDFGIARAATDTRLTGTGAVMGSWAYMAPERFDSDADLRADVYALACVLHECLTGGPPFEGNSLERQYSAHKFTPPPRPSVARPGVPAGLDTVIAKGMAKNPDDRYQTCSELAAAARSAVMQPSPAPQPRVDVEPAPPPRPMPSSPPAQAGSQRRPVLPSPPSQVRRVAPPPAPPPASPPQFRPVGSPGSETPHAAPPGRKRTRTRWIALAAVVAVPVIAGVGFGVARSIIKSHYYVGDFNGTVAIMQGDAGKFFGLSLHEAYAFGCVNARNEVTRVPVNQGRPSDCRLMKLTDLRPAESVQVRAGLPSGTLAEATRQLDQLAASSLLPPCPTRQSAPPTVPASPSETQPGVDCRAVS